MLQNCNFECSNGERCIEEAACGTPDAMSVVVLVRFVDHACQMLTS